VLWTMLVVIALAGAMGAAMVNRGVAVFHDGLRALMPELIEGRMGRAELIVAASGLSLGLLLGFGIPFSLASTILLTHSLWLGTDMIGTWFPGAFQKDGSSDWKSRWGLAGAIAAGAVYGGFLVLGLEAVTTLCERLPVKFLVSMELSTPILLTFAACPAIAVAYQYGIKNGLVAFLTTLLARQAASALGTAQPDAWALGVGLAILIFYAIWEKKDKEPVEGIASLFVDRANRIRRNLPALAVLGGIYGMACNLSFMMEGPQSAIALGQGDKAAAIGITIARALSFVPLKAMSALTTGVFAMDGFGFVATAGLASPNVIVAAIAGAVVMSLEASSLVAVIHFLDHFPGILQAADNIRTAMTKLLEVASLVGGMMAANSMAPTLGLFVAAGLYLLNETAGTPIVRVAIGPVAVILIGLAANLMVLAHLYVPAA
jgi:hypothetical protein